MSALDKNDPKYPALILANAGEGHEEAPDQSLKTNVVGAEHPLFSANGAINAINMARGLANSQEKALSGKIPDKVFADISDAARKTKFPLDLLMFATDWEKDLTSRQDASDAAGIAQKMTGDLPSLRSALGRDPIRAELFASHVLNSASKVKEILDNSENKPEDEAQAPGSKKDDILLYKIRGSKLQKRNNRELYDFFYKRIMNGKAPFLEDLGKDVYNPSSTSSSSGGGSGLTSAVSNVLNTVESIIPRTIFDSISPPPSSTATSQVGYVLSGDLEAIEGLTANGFPVRVSENNWVVRTLEAGNNVIITYPDGKLGNPVISAVGSGGSISANDILTKLKTVDGAGSGLDADTLDGLESSDFATADQGVLANNAMPKSGGTFSGGIDFGSSIASGPNDLSRHIALWGTNNYGFNVTGSTLNYNSDNRHDFYSASTFVARINSSAVLANVEFQSTSANSFRSVFGNYGTFWRNDGNSLYLMITESGNQYGGWDSTKPFPFVVNLSTHNVTMNGNVSIAGVVNVANTFTVTSSIWPQVSANKPSSGSYSGIAGKTNNSLRWFFALGDNTAESGSNAGSDFGIFRYSDTGTFLGQPLKIFRATGGIQLQNATGGDPGGGKINAIDYLVNGTSISSTYMPIIGGTFTGGISLGSVAVASATDLSRHISLWGTQFGFSITNNSMNYVVNSSSGHHIYVGSTEIAKVLSTGLYGTSIYENGTAISSKYVSNSYFQSTYGTFSGDVSFNGNVYFNNSTTDSQDIIWKDTTNNTQVNVDFYSEKLRFYGAYRGGGANIICYMDPNTGRLLLTGDPTTALGAATKQYVDNNYAALSGDTFTGSVTVTGDLTTTGTATSDFLTFTRAIQLSGTLTDLNNLTTGGFYNGASLTNSPDGSAGWFYIQVIRHVNANGYCLQLAWSLTSTNPIPYYRTQTGSTWNAWRQIVSTANDATLAAGFAGTVVNDGTKSTGTYTPTYASGNLRKVSNAGAFTLAAPTAAGDYTMVILVTNATGAGAIASSGFTSFDGDSFDTTVGSKFLVVIYKIDTSVVGINKKIA